MVEDRRPSVRMGITTTHPMPVLPPVIGGRNISTTASSLVSGRGGVGAIATAGAAIASMATTVGTDANLAVLAGIVATVAGMMIANAVNGTKHGHWRH